MTASGELCCVALPFCCASLPSNHLSHALLCSQVMGGYDFPGSSSVSNALLELVALNGTEPLQLGSLNDKQDTLLSRNAVFVYFNHQSGHLLSHCCPDEATLY